MRPPAEKESPGWRTRAVNLECNLYLNDSNFFHKYQAFSLFFLLTQLIPIGALVEVAR